MAQRPRATGTGSQQASSSFNDSDPLKHWSATTTADRNRDGGFAFHFDVPADAASSALSERPARFWQLVVKSDDVRGVDYKASFLVPVYARRR